MGVDAVVYLVVPERAFMSNAADEVLSLSCDMVEAFGADYFSIYRPGAQSWHPKGQHALEIMPPPSADDWRYPVPARPNDLILELNIHTRYYGEDGYERGDLPFILAVTQYLQDRLPAAKIYYDGDSGDELRLLDEPRRKRLWQHFVEVGHKPYNGFFGADKKNTTCEFCKRPRNNYGGGHGREFESCDSCGSHVITQGGMILIESKDAFFATSKRLDEEHHGE